MNQQQEDENITANLSDFDSEQCLNVPQTTADAVLGVKIGLDSVGILASLTVIFIICILRNYKRFMYRLVIYLMAVNIIQAVCQILGLVPVQVTEDERVSIRDGAGWFATCQTLGYLDLVSFWMENLVIIWIMLALVWRLYHLQNGRYQDTMSVVQEIKTSRRWEILGIAIVLLSPFLLGCIPFTIGMYGISDLWCWIKTVRRNGCGDTDLAQNSLILTLCLTYGPLLTITIFAFVCMIGILLLLRRTSKVSLVENPKQFHHNINQIGIALVYPIIQAIFCAYLIGNRIYTTITQSSVEDHRPIYALWIIHAVADTSRILIPALAFLLHPYTWKSVLSQSRSTHPEMTMEEYVDNCAEVSPVFESDPEEDQLTTQTAYREYGNSAEAWTLF